MNNDAQVIILKEIDAGEKLLWAGKPKQGTMFRMDDVFKIPLSLLWTGMIIFWEVLALGIKSDIGGIISIILPVLGIPLVIFGLYMIFGRFIYDSKKRSKTFYGVTDQRALIVSGLFTKDLKSINLKTLCDISLSERSHGRGTISFGQERLLLTMLLDRSFAIPKFELIKDVRLVFDLLRAQQKHQ